MLVGDYTMMRTAEWATCGPLEAGGFEYSVPGRAAGERPLERTIA